MSRVRSQTEARLSTGPRRETSADARQRSVGHSHPASNATFRRLSSAGRFSRGLTPSLLTGETEEPSSPFIDLRRRVHGNDADGSDHGSGLNVSRNWPPLLSPTGNTFRVLPVAVAGPERGRRGFRAREPPSLPPTRSPLRRRRAVGGCDVSPAKPPSVFACRGGSIRVGTGGFEPPASCSQSRRANQAALRPVASECTWRVSRS